MEVSTIEDGPDADDNEDVFVTCEAVGVAPYPDLTITVDGCVLSIIVDARGKRNISLSKQSS